MNECLQHYERKNVMSLEVMLDIVIMKRLKLRETKSICLFKQDTLLYIEI